MAKTTELNNVLSYITETLVFEAPVHEITIEYLIASILDNKNCHAHFIMEECLMSANIEELRKIYDDFLHKKSSSNSILRNSEKPKFDKELEIVLQVADEEAVRSSSKLTGTEHVLLALLNKDTKIKDNTFNILTSVGLSYSLVLGKCVEAQQQVERHVIKKRKKRENEQKLLKDIQEVKINSDEIVPQQKRVMSQNISNANNSQPQIIAKHTINLTKLAKNGGLSDLIGREKEVKQIVKTLARQKKNNAILVGPSGCGKTQIVYGLANYLASGKAPTSLEDKEILLLNTMSLISGTHLRGMFEERVRNLFDELKRHKKYILFIDNMQYALKSSSKDNDADLTSVLSDVLNEGEVRIIGAVTPKAYHTSVESNQTVASKMQKIMIDPMSVNDTITLMEIIKKRYEYYHNVYYPLNVVSVTVKLAERYITDRCLPDSALDVMDLCGAQTVFTPREPKEITEVRNRLKDIEDLKRNAVACGEFTELDLLIDEENKHKLTLANFAREYEGCRDAYCIDITEDDVANVISDMVGIPANKLNVDEKKKIANIDKILKNEIIGQDDAIETVCKAIKRNKIGLNNPKKPLGVFLSIGESGTGKTLLAKKLAEQIYGDENALIRIDMSEYSEKNSVTKLTGSAPGYVGYDNGGQLTEAVKNKQYCVLLLDEIEKADESVYNIFLQLFDEGRLTDSSGAIVNFKNVIIIMTSNVGTRKANELGKGVGFTNDVNSNKKNIINKELRRKFTPEFLNRIDKIVHFNSLTDDNLKEIVKLELNKFVKRMDELHYKINYNEDVVDYIHKLAISEKEFGARPIIRLIQDNIEDKITDLLLENDYENGHEFVIQIENDEISIK